MAEQVFIEQTLLLKLDTNIDLSGATVTRILWEDPHGNDGFWVASVNGEYLQYTIQETDITIVGMWKFRAYVEIGSDTYTGAAAKKYFGNNS